MNLADSLLDPDTIEWQSLALCSGVEFEDYMQNPFFEAYETNENVAKSTDQMCLHCPVTKQCYEFGVNERETGVWGGIYLDRGKIDKNKNAHKTQEVWLQILEKVNGDS